MERKEKNIENKSQRAVGARNRQGGAYRPIPFPEFLRQLGRTGEQAEGKAFLGQLLEPIHRLGQRIARIENDYCFSGHVYWFKLY